MSTIMLPPGARRAAPNAWASDMANGYCEGDFFEADGARYYRCMWDGAVAAATAPGTRCPNCGREIAGQDHGRLAVQTLRFVVVPGLLAEVRLPPDAGDE